MKQSTKLKNTVLGVTIMAGIGGLGIGKFGNPHFSTLLRRIGDASMSGMNRNSLFVCFGSNFPDRVSYFHDYVWPPDKAMLYITDKDPQVVKINPEPSTTARLIA